MYLWPEIASGALRLSYVDAGGIRTRYVEAGNPSADEAVVFVPGTGGHLEAFTRNLLPHGKEYRTIALDMIGHGYTDKPDHDYEIRHYVKHLADFSDALGLKRIHLHGESLGGWIAAQFAIDRGIGIDVIHQRRMRGTDHFDLHVVCSFRRRWRSAAARCARRGMRDAGG